jgi:hypothetical protein
VSTGYAGFLGALLHRQRGLIVTEHGIYTKERKIDLARAAWIREESAPGNGGLGQALGYLRQLWIRFFEGLGRAAYASARPIVSLYEGNRARQGIEVQPCVRRNRGRIQEQPEYQREMHEADGGQQPGSGAIARPEGRERRSHQG